MQSFPEFIVEAKKLGKDDAKQIEDKLESETIKILGKPKAKSGNIILGVGTADMGIEPGNSAAVIVEVIVRRKRDQLFVDEFYMVEDPDEELDGKVIKKLGEDFGVKMSEESPEEHQGEQTNKAKDMEEVVTMIDFIAGKVKAAFEAFDKATK